MTHETDPDISVVMSVYNGAELIRESVDCILSQEEVNLELVVIDDGSTDGTGAILDDFALKDRRIRVVHQENTGLTRALIRGCREARGKYIARHDCGDISFPRRLAELKEALDTDPNLSFVSSWTEFCGPEQEFLYLSKGSGQAEAPVNIISGSVSRLIIDGPSCHPSVMFRKHCYDKAGGYRPEFYFGQDWDLWYRLAEVGQFRMIRSVLYRARVMPGSISAAGRAEQKELGKLSREGLRLRLAGLSDEPVLQAAAKIRPLPRNSLSKDSRKIEWLYFIGEILRQNGDRRARCYFGEALRENFFHARAWFRLIQTLFVKVPDPKTRQKSLQKHHKF